MILLIKGIFIALVIIAAIALIIGFSAAIYIGHLIDD